MPTLRQIVDGRTLLAQTPSKPSDAASHVAKHMQDPFGATKDQLDKLNKAKMNYELEKQNAVMQLKPVEDVVQGIKNMHRLDTPDGSAQNMGNGMMNPDIAQAGQFGPQTPQDGSGGQIDPDTGLPINMNQTPGDMNQNRPSQAGFSPGVSPGPAESVRPGKMGLPQPGQGNAGARAGMPSGWGQPGTGSNPQNNQFNPSAPKPPGAGQLPGAKGPGDPKVQNQVKKAQGGGNGGSKPAAAGNRPIKIQVHADSKTPSGAPMPLAAAIGVANLRSYGTSEGVEKSWDTRGRKGAVEKGTTNRHGGDWRQDYTRPYADSDHGINSPANRAYRERTNQPMKGGVVKARDFSQGKRKKLAKTGAAMPHGGFPIVNRGDLANAKRAIGRAKNRAATIRHINERARALGAPGFEK